MAIEKLVEQISTLSVTELGDLVAAIETKFGVSAAMPTAAAAGATASEAAPAEEKLEFKVTLQDSGTEKIKVIKALRQVLPTLSLSDAKKAAEEAPTVLGENVAKDEAKKMKQVLEEAGAKVQLA
jgi:large subunit ribosomal protein L7/L12